MNYRINVKKEVSQAIYAHGFERGDTLQIFNRIYGTLENDADVFRSRRVPGRPDRFWFRFVMVIHPTWYVFKFEVDDQNPDDALIVVDMHVSSRPAQ